MTIFTYMFTPTFTGVCLANSKETAFQKFQLMAHTIPGVGKIELNTVRALTPAELTRGLIL